MITLNKRFKTPVRKIFPRFIACRRLRIQGRCRKLLRLCWPLQVFFFLRHKSPSGAFSACARYKSMLHKLDQRSKPEHRAQSTWLPETRWAKGSVFGQEKMTNKRLSSVRDWQIFWVNLIKKCSRTSENSTEFEQISVSDQLKSLVEDTWNAYRLLAWL